MDKNDDVPELLLCKNVVDSIVNESKDVLSGRLVVSVAMSVGELTGVEIDETILVELTVFVEIADDDCVIELML